MLNLALDLKLRQTKNGARAGAHLAKQEVDDGGFPRATYRLAGEVLLEHNNKPRFFDQLPGSNKYCLKRSSHLKQFKFAYFVVTAQTR